MHPNRATSTLFSGFLIIPVELTRLIKSQGHEQVTANVQPKPGQQGPARKPASFDIPVGRLPDEIAMPPKGFFAMGYEPGDPMQFSFDGKALEISYLGPNIADQVANCEVDDAGVRIPPGWLIQAFTGVPDTIDHIENGKRSADFYVDLFNRFCGNFDDVERVLDFGCGCGRVLARMPANGNTRYYGVDLRDDAIEWLRATMPEGTFTAGSAMPPTDPGAQDFDLIYSVSVLTHLTQEQEHAWLDEWSRLLKPGGHVIATFRGEDWVEQFGYDNQKDAIRQAWRDNDGFCYQKHGYWEGIFPEYYSGTYQTLDYVRSTWGKRFEIIDILPAADTSNEQNTAVMRKRS